jgi:hypothetical protein
MGGYINITAFALSAFGPFDDGSPPSADFPDPSVSVPEPQSLASWRTIFFRDLEWHSPFDNAQLHPACFFRPCFMAVSETGRLHGRVGATQQVSEIR